MSYRLERTTPGWRAVSHHQIHTRTRGNYPYPGAMAADGATATARCVVCGRVGYGATEERGVLAPHDATEKAIARLNEQPCEIAEEVRKCSMPGSSDEVAAHAVADAVLDCLADTIVERLGHGHILVERGARELSRSAAEKIRKLGD